MKTKILYVLVSSDNDIYLEQAYVSIRSAKHHMPDAKIVVLTDEISNNTFIGKREKMLEDVDEKIVVKLDSNFTAKQRSRILKTSFRNHVDGDALFIDCDTIITSPLNEIDSCTYDLAACRDSHSLFADNPYKKMCVDHCKRLGLDISDEQNYFNSGVILAKDTQNVRDFFTQWNECWQEGSKNGVQMDQPSFAVTNIRRHYPVKELSGIWNCQIIHGLRYFKDAKIIHYLCTSQTKPGDRQMFILRDKTVLSKIKKTGEIPKDISNIYDNIYQGFPETVHILSGENVKLMQSESFLFLQRNFNNNLFRIFELLFRCCNILNKITRHITKR